MFFLDGAVGPVNAALLGAIPGVVLSVLVWGHRESLVDHRIKARAEEAGGPSPWSLFLQPTILLCLAFFALVAATTVGIQQFAVPAFQSMFGASQGYAAFCLIAFVFGSAGGMLLGGYFADRMRHHERVAAIGLLVAAAFTLPIATLAVPPVLLPFLLFGAGFAGGTTNPSRDMIVRQVTPPGASGKVFGFVYSGLDIGSFLAPLVFGQAMNLGHPAAMFWIAIGLYLLNATLVTVIRQTATPRAIPAAAE
jgi:predicted MFS family arabinose efflux permease